MSDGKGYLTPDPPDPEGLLCLKIYIPEHSLYVAAFWGAYQFFTHWNAWARDPLHKGLAAARVWSKAYELAREHWVKFKGACFMAITAIRQDPLDPCRIQAQFDGGPEWTQVLDMSCCGGGGGGGGCLPPLRVGTNGAIESYDPQTGEWSDTAPTITPANAEEVPPAYEGDPEAQCKAANGYYALLLDTLEKVLVAADQAGNWGAFAAEVMAWLNTIFNIALPIFQQAWAFLEGVYALLDVETAARIAARDDIDFFCEVFSCTEGNGTYTQAGIDRLRQMLYDKAETEAVEEKKWWYVHAGDIVGIMGLTAANKGASYQVATPLDCSDCEWTADIDFRELNGGFQAQLLDPFSLGGLRRYGLYVPGEGWKSTNDGGVGSPYHNLMIVTLPTDTFNCRQIELYTQQDPEGGPCYDSYPHPGDGIDGLTRYVTTTFTTLSGVIVGEDHAYYCDPVLYNMSSGISDRMIDRLTMICGVGSLGYAPQQGTIWARRLIIHGKGAIPPQLVAYVTGA